MGDDSPVKIQGHIVKALGDETYEFQDESGILVVEIDDEEWGSLEVEPTDRVELRGEIDKDLQKTDLEVDHIRLVQ